MKNKNILLILKVGGILYNTILGIIGGLGLLFSNITLFSDSGSDFTSLLFYLLILFIGNIGAILIGNKISNEYITLWDWLKFSIVPYMISLVFPFLIYNIVF